MKTGERNIQQRVSNKLGLLKKMQEAGIWLIDASVCALVREGKRVPQDRCQAVLKVCWESHIRTVLCECSPCRIVIVGIGVNDAIGARVRGELGPDIVKVVSQPNGRMKDIPQYRRKCFELSCDRSQDATVCYVTGPPQG